MPNSINCDLPNSAKCKFIYFSEKVKFRCICILICIFKTWACKYIDTSTHLYISTTMYTHIHMSYLRPYEFGKLNLAGILQIPFAPLPVRHDFLAVSKKGKVTISLPVRHDFLAVSSLSRPLSLSLSLLMTLTISFSYGTTAAQGH